MKNGKLDLQKMLKKSLAPIRIITAFMLIMCMLFFILLPYGTHLHSNAVAEEAVGMMSMESSSSEMPEITSATDLSIEQKNLADPQTTMAPESSVEPQPSMESKTTTEMPTSGKPDNSMEPQTSVEQEASPEPAQPSTEPQNTAEAQTTAEPDDSMEPQTSVEPEASPEPAQPSMEPQNTAEAQTTAEPDDSMKPQTSVEPEASPEPTQPSTSASFNATMPPQAAVGSADIVVRWNAVEGAAVYSVRLEGTMDYFSNRFTATEYTLPAEWLKIPGSYTLTVQSYDEQGSFVVESSPLPFTVTPIESEKLSTPVLSASATEVFVDTIVTVSWEAVDGAESYICKQASETMSYIGEEITDTNYDIVINSAGINTLSVIACASDKQSSDAAVISIIGKVKGTLANPIIHEIGTQQVNTAFTITWDAVENAEGYRVSTNKGVYSTNQPSYTFPAGEFDETGSYIIWVYAYAEGYESTSAEATVRIANIDTETLPAPENLTIHMEEYGIRATWDSVDGAESYRVSYAGMDENVNVCDYVLDWQYYNQEGTYTFSVFAVASGKTAESVSLDFIIEADDIPDIPVLHVPSIHPYDEQLTISWGATLNATAYAYSLISLDPPSEWYLTDTIYSQSTLSVQFDNLPQAGEYMFSLTVFGKYGTRKTADVTFLVQTRLDAPIINDITAYVYPDNDCIITWESVPNATKYVVQVNMPYVFDFLGLDTNSFTDTVTSPYYTLNRSLFNAAGMAYITVTALADGYVSAESTEPFEIICKGQLAAPSLNEITAFVNTNCEIGWESIPNATSYSVNVSLPSGMTYSQIIASNSLTLEAACFDTVGVGNYTVKAMAEGYYPAMSNAHIGVFKGKLDDPIINDVFAQVNANCIISWKGVPNAEEYEIKLELPEADDQGGLLRRSATSATRYIIDKDDLTAPGIGTVTIKASAVGYLSGICMKSFEITAAGKLKAPQNMTIENMQENGTVLINQKIYVMWDDVTDAEKYVVGLYRNDERIASDYPSDCNTSFEISELGEYTVQVVAEADGYVSGDASLFSFRAIATADPLPATEHIVVPQESFIEGTSYAFSWEPVEGAEFYYIEWRKSSNSSSHEKTYAANCFIEAPYVPSDLESCESVLTVTAAAAGRTGTPKSVSLTINRDAMDLEPPTISAPDSVQTSTAFDISWTESANADRYYIRIWNMNSPGEIFSCYPQNRLSQRIPETVLNDPGDYRIQVTAYSGKKGASASKNLTVKNQNGVLDAPQIEKISAVTLGKEYRLEWGIVDNAAFYTIEINNDSIITIGRLILEDCITQNSYIVPASAHDSTGSVVLTVTAHAPGYTSCSSSINYEVLSGSSSDEPALGFTMSPNPVTVGQSVSFSVTAPDAEKVKLVVDDVEYEEYTVTDGEALFSRVFTQEGSRRVQFKALLNGAWSDACTAQVLQVNAITQIDAPVVSVGEVYVGESFDVFWTAVEHATQYTIYLYKDNVQLWKGMTESDTLKITIPGSVISQEGTYSVDVYAAGEGYSQNSGNAQVQVKTAVAELLLVKQGNYSQWVIEPAGSSFPFTITASSHTTGVSISGATSTSLLGQSPFSWTAQPTVSGVHVYVFAPIGTNPGSSRTFPVYVYDAVDAQTYYVQQAIAAFTPNSSGTVSAVGTYDMNAQVQVIGQIAVNEQEYWVVRTGGNTNEHLIKADTNALGNTPVEIIDPEPEKTCENGYHVWEIEYEDMHPHAEYRKCQKCGKLELTGATQKQDNCCECIGHSYNEENVCIRCGSLKPGDTDQTDPSQCDHVWRIACEDMHPHTEYRKCQKCGKLELTGATKKQDNCCECIGHSYNEKNVCIRCGSSKTGNTDQPEKTDPSQCDHVFSLKNCVFGEHPHKNAYALCIKCGTKVALSVGNYAVPGCDLCRGKSEMSIIFEKHRQKYHVTKLSDLSSLLISDDNISAILEIRTISFIKGNTYLEVHCHICNESWRVDVSNTDVPIIMEYWQPLMKINWKWRINEKCLDFCKKYSEVITIVTDKDIYIDSSIDLSRVIFKTTGRITVESNEKLELTIDSCKEVRVNSNNDITLNMVGETECDVLVEGDGKCTIKGTPSIGKLKVKDKAKATILPGNDGNNGSFAIKQIELNDESQLYVNIEELSTDELTVTGSSKITLVSHTDSTERVVKTKCVVKDMTYDSSASIDFDLSVSGKLNIKKDVSFEKQLSIDDSSKISGKDKIEYIKEALIDGYEFCELKKEQGWEAVITGILKKVATEELVNKTSVAKISLDNVVIEEENLENAVALKCAWQPDEKKYKEELKNASQIIANYILTHQDMYNVVYNDSGVRLELSLKQHTIQQTDSDGTEYNLVLSTIGTKDAKTWWISGSIRVNDREIQLQNRVYSFGNFEAMLNEKYKELYNIAVEEYNKQVENAWTEAVGLGFAPIDEFISILNDNDLSKSDQAYKILKDLAKKIVAKKGKTNPFDIIDATLKIDNLSSK